GGDDRRRDAVVRMRRRLCLRVVVAGVRAPFRQSLVEAPGSRLGAVDQVPRRRVRSRPPQSAGLQLGEGSGPDAIPSRSSVRDAPGPAARFNGSAGRRLPRDAVCRAARNNLPAASAMTSLLKRLLAEPAMAGLDLDAASTASAARALIESKPFLRRVYNEWYTMIAAGLPATEGPILELGSGGGFLAARLEGVIASDVLP